MDLGIMFKHRSNKQLSSNMFQSPEDQDSAPTIPPPTTTTLVAAMAVTLAHGQRFHRNSVAVAMVPKGVSNDYQLSMANLKD